MNNYIANIIVFSEILSVIQSILSVYDVTFSYLNLLVFFALCMPLLFRAKFPVSMLVLVLVYLILITTKVMLQGVEKYHLKALIILLTLPIYFLLISKTTFENIVDACKRYRAFALLLGLCYVLSWHYFGTYRNASTVTICLILILGYRQFLIQLFTSLPFAFVMKTQYKFWIVIAMLGVFLRSFVVRRMVLFLAALIAATFPLLLLSLDISWFNFSPSQISSLSERLSEVKAFKEVFSHELGYFFYGWEVGMPIQTDEVNDRGYMHSTYLWITGTLGFPLSACIFYYIVSRNTISWKCFFIRLFLVLSNAFTFFLFTNPFCTALMFANEKKKSY